MPGCQGRTGHAIDRNHARSRSCGLMPALPLFRPGEVVGTFERLGWRVARQRGTLWVRLSTIPFSMFYQTNPFFLPTQTKQTTYDHVDEAARRTGGARFSLPSERSSDRRACSPQTRALSPSLGGANFPPPPLQRPQLSGKYGNSALALKMQSGLIG